jgi:hypothetical protein
VTEESDDDRIGTEKKALDGASSHVDGSLFSTSLRLYVSTSLRLYVSTSLEEAGLAPPIVAFFLCLFQTTEKTSVTLTLNG